MDIKIIGSRHELVLVGPISEKTAIFEHDIRKATEVAIDMEKVTFINSIGVKNWITWAMSLSPFCQVTLLKCPYVIINQANIVQGFLPRNTKIESFIAPYICEKCGHETHTLVARGKDYEYKTATSDKVIQIPKELPCTKCQGVMEPDFMIEKTFSFLSPKE